MENTKSNFQGDLSDIIRASYGSCIISSSSSTVGTCSSVHDHWMLLSDDPIMTTMDLEQDHRRGCSFGDPFSNMRDPFLQDQLVMPLPADGPAAYYFNNSSSSSGSGGGVLEDAACVLSKGNIVEDDMMMRRPATACNNIILSNMIQISPKAKLPVSSTCCGDSPKIATKTASAVVSVAGNTINASTSNKDHGLLLVEHNTGEVAVQISSPRNNPAGLKRRKSQAKKSICIPAPTAPNSRQSGEVVPSDLWAWRKYGQKPIKGSPHPRGYYRCSSSKGCPARKQVERSRTDPNMLVITYTSEHNHPWPTQRNALAGSSRSQPSKNNVINSASASKNNNSSETTDEPHNKGGTSTTNLPQEEEQESNSDLSNAAENSSANNNASVKEKQQQLLEVDDDDDDDGEFRNGSSVVPNYKNNKQLLEDLFAKLGETEVDDEYGDSIYERFD